MRSETKAGGRHDGYRNSNGFGRPVELTVSYSDGSAQAAPWPACRILHVGRANREVVRLSILDGDRRIELSAEQFRELLQAEVASDAQVVWRVSGSDIARIDALHSTPCEATGHD